MAPERVRNWFFALGAGRGGSKLIRGSLIALHAVLLATGMPLRPDFVYGKETEVLRDHHPSRHYISTPDSTPGVDVHEAKVVAISKMSWRQEEKRRRDLPDLNPFEFAVPLEKVAGDRNRPTVSISELQQLASQHNPTLKLVTQKIHAANANAFQAGLKPNPVLAYEAEEMGDGGKAGKHGIVLEQEVILGGKRKLDRTIAGWEKEAVRRRWELQCQSIQNDVRARAYEMLAAQRLVAINLRLTEIGRKSIEVAEELQRAGEVSRIDLLQIRAKANEAKASLQAAQNAEHLAWKRIAIMVGLAEMSPCTITDSLESVRPVFDRETAWQWVVDCSPTLAISRTAIRQARVTLIREQAEKIPDVTVGGGLHYDYGERQTLGSFNVGMPLKIFDRNQGNIRKARAELAAAFRELDRQTLLLSENFEEIHSTLDTAEKQVGIYKNEILPDVEQSLELSLKGYMQGEYGYMDILNAQQLYLESQTQYVQSLKDYAIACVYLDGFLASGGLENAAE